MDSISQISFSMNATNNIVVTNFQSFDVKSNSKLDMS